MKVNCPKCGFADEGNFCSKCGSALDQAVPAKKDSPRMLAEAFWTERCPVCQSGQLKEETRKGLLFGVAHTDFVCNTCGADFRPIDKRFALMDTNDKHLPAWNDYKLQKLTVQEWTEVTNAGVYDPEQREADIGEYLALLRNGQVPTTIGTQSEASSVLLKSNEEVQILLPNIALWEARAVRISSGGYGGPSFRVTRGVSFRVGAFSSQSSSYSDLTQIDRGRLTVTNQRLVFSGLKRTSEVNLAKIVSIEPYSDGIAVQATGRTKTQCFVGIDAAPMPVKITMNERTYCEPFNGLILQYMIEGLAKRQQETRSISSRKPRSQRLAHEQSIPEQIVELGKLRDADMISAEEFESKKKELLDRM